VTPSKQEKIILHRRRRGELQGEAAKRLKVSKARYQRWELGLEDVPAKAVPALGPLKKHEKCFLERKRRGLTIEQVSLKIGFCKMWVNKMELGTLNCDRLAEFYVGNPKLRAA
jgi:transcriptional regulator with XRE-family HTH domain